MDKNSWIGLAMIFAILFGWSYFTKPSEAELAELKRSQDSIAFVQQERSLQEAIRKDQAAPIAISDTDERDDESIAAEAVSLYGDFASFSTGEKEFYTIENDLMVVKFSNLGGRIYSVELKEYKTHDGNPLVLFDGDSTIFGLNFFAKNRNIATNNLFFITDNEPEVKVSSDKASSITFTLPIAEGQYMEYVYSLTSDGYVVDFDINMENMNELISSNADYLNLEWQSYITGFEKGESWEQQNTTIYFKPFQESVDNLSERSDDDRENVSTRVKWVSYKQQFFNVALIAKNSFENADMAFEKEVVNPKYLKFFSSEIGVPYEAKASENIPMQFYFGPNHYQTLKKLDLDLEEVIPMGKSVFRWVNVYVVVPLFNWLGKFISNYGIIILIMTIMIKVVLFPFTYKSYMSTAKMKALKPEIDKATEKFSKPEDSVKKQQETMKIYKKVGVSPMGGCLPMLFQMPILIAMFRFFPSSIELRQKSFLWATDLSTYDAVIQLPFTVPFGFGDHISLFCLLMTVVNIIYMKTNDQMSAAGTTQMPGMKAMMYMMPLMMLFWFNSYASALSYYYFVSLLITILQTWLIRRSVNDEEILAKLKAAQASKKPVKKSKWQQRMEDMAKQRGISSPKK